jgi:trimeric autotransporter adhesin
LVFMKTKIYLLVTLFVVGSFTIAQNITTVAGGGGGDGTLATLVGLNSMAGGLATDVSGNLYIADTYNQRIRKINISSGLITTVAGNGRQWGGATGDGGLATSAHLYNPSGVALDTAGNIYFTDTDLHRIRKVTVSTGIITTVAGNGYSGYNGDGISATSARIGDPKGIAIDTNGNIYFTDPTTDRVRKVSSGGIITTIVGNGIAGSSGDGGLASVAQVNNPIGIAVDGAGNIYIADETNHKIRKVDATTGNISTIAGTGVGGYSGEGGLASSAQLRNPSGVAIDAIGNIYIADVNNQRIRKIDNVTGIITTIMLQEL